MTRELVLLTVRLPEDMLSTLQAIADRAGCSIDAVVSICLAREVVGVAAAQAAAVGLRRGRGDAK